MNERLWNVKNYVEPGEKILSFVIGIYEKENFFFSYQQGILVATNRRVLFYGKFEYYPAIFEEYSYLYMDEIDMYPQLVFTHKNETVSAKHIQGGNVKEFVHVVRANLN